MYILIEYGKQYYLFALIYDDLKARQTTFNPISKCPWREAIAIEQLIWDDRSEQIQIKKGSAKVQLTIWFNQTFNWKSKVHNPNIPVNNFEVAAEF